MLIKFIIPMLLLFALTAMPAQAETFLEYFTAKTAATTVNPSSDYLVLLQGGAVKKAAPALFLPSAMTCPGGQHLSAYNSSTSAFTCSADTGSGGGAVDSINGQTGAVTLTLPATISCSAGNHVATYTPGTGAFTCTTDATSGGSMTWPGATGIAVYSGSSAWGTSLVAPSGTIVGTTDTQTLTNKTISTGSTWIGNPITSGYVAILNQNTTGTAAGLSATLVTGSGGTGITDFSLSGSAHKVASAGFTNPASNKCVEVDSNGNLQISATNSACSSGASMTWPSGSGGIAVYSGSSTWGTTLTAPSGTIVGTTDTQTLTNKTITAPAVTTVEIDGHANGTNLTAAQVSRTTIHNYGQGANDVTLNLPTAAAGYSFIMAAAETQTSNKWRIKAQTGDTLYLDGTAGSAGGYIRNLTPTVSNYLSCMTIRVGTGYAWNCRTGLGLWGAE